MQVKEIMTKAPETVSPEMTVEEAARCMGDLNVGFVPIAEGDSVIGVVTDRDIAIRAVAEGREPKQTRVRDIMSENVQFVPQDESLEAATRVMQDNQVRRLLVRDGDGGVVGVVSLGDLAVATNNRELYAEALETISQPAQPRR